MLIRKGYKHKLKPDSRAELLMMQMSGCCRFLWNLVLARNLRRLERKEPLLWYYELAFWLTLWKKSEEYGFLKGCHSQSLQQVLKNLDRAFRDCFDKTQPNKKMPTFKKRGIGDSFSYPQGFKIDNRRIFLPKIGWIGFHKSVDIIGTPKNVTLTKEVDGWYVSIQVEIEQAEPIHPSLSMVGIDVGIACFATLSNGEVFNSHNYYRKYEKILAKAQQKLARKTKFSNGWKRQKKCIAKIHKKIRSCRDDFLHKISRIISKNHAIVVLEDLKIKNMSQTAGGSIEEPGIGVKAKSGLNKSILDQGWGRFKTMLGYKLSWLGGKLIFVDPRYTSQKCPECKTCDVENRKTQKEFCCISCGYTNNADFVGARNILAAGLAVMACKANHLSGRQQEPVMNREVLLPCVG